MRRIYLDTCLLIAYFYPRDSQNKHQISRDFFSRVNNMRNVELYCSHFTITEFTWAYVTKPEISDLQAHKIAHSLLLTNKIDRKYPFNLLNIEGKEKKYSFEDFFLDVETILLNTTPRPNLADAIHATIMKNNGIHEIVTFDISDFEHIEDIIPCRPEDIIR